MDLAPLPLKLRGASDRPGWQKLQHDVDDIGVRSFILTGAPINTINNLAGFSATVAAAAGDSFSRLKVG
jgi:hypothetical protein